MLAAWAVSIALAAAGCSTTAPSTSPESTPSATETATPTPTPEAPQLDALLDAEVPSLCEHPAGTLVDGALPGIEEGMGHVTLGEDTIEAATSGASSTPAVVRHLDAVGAPFIAAIMHCDQGGVRWPDQVVVWDADMRLLGVFDPTLYPEPYAAGARQAVWEITPIDGGFHVRWTGMTPYDPACCGQLSMEMPVQVDGGVVAGELTTHRGEEQVEAAFAAAQAGEQADGVPVPDGFYEDVAVTLERMQSIDLDGITCIDTEFGAEIDPELPPAISCGVPGIFEDGSEVAFVVYTVLESGWGEYAITAMDPSLGPL